MNFESLKLCAPLLKSLKAAGYQTPTPIQKLAIPEIIKGNDLVGCAQTGTGKTAAFTLPILQRLLSSPTVFKTIATPNRRKGRKPQPTKRRAIRALILTPTRELAAQIDNSLATYGKHTKLKHTVVYGGVKRGPQVRALQSGVDVLVATPGRLLDLVGQRHIDLSAVEVLTLDEADLMLDMGFLPDLKRIVACVPADRQTLMFSATMPKEIRELARQWLEEPVHLKADPVASTPKLVSQSVCFVEQKNRSVTLTKLLNDIQRKRTLVFSRTKHGADKVARALQRDGIRAVSIHGDKSQSKRQAALRDFNSKRPPVLVATDLAARGLDISGISHVINFDMPDTPETYVHRIGRTARAGSAGEAITFCGRGERKRLKVIEKLTGQPVAVRPLPRTESQSKSEAKSADAVESGESNSGGTSTSETARKSKDQSAKVSTKGRKQRSRVSNRTKHSKQGRSRSRSGASATRAGQRRRKSRPNRSQSKSRSNESN